MRLAMTVAALAAGLTLVGATGPTPARAVEFSVGPGGVHVDRGHRWYDRGECRVIIEHHTNRWGEDVTVRRRVCD